ncbi:hypothetical protein Acr_00g0038720 [Actinidia rufa]|uniref:Uncharacterized protein n=1 Tax=Actinidia rufa TaxID=165716 RepID=A0A7J0DIG7_9ERIC|nr:hypothetical protein Acr_00g0038720 [Actinidia rufa]
MQSSPCAHQGAIHALPHREAESRDRRRRASRAKIGRALASDEPTEPRQTSILGRASLQRGDVAVNVNFGFSLTYSRRGNIAQVYDLQQCVNRLDQAEMTPLQYSSAFTTLWQYLDHLANYTPICPTDTIAFKKFIDRQRIFKFLAGLRDEYDQVQCRILNIDPILSLTEAFAIIQNEESHRGVMLPPGPSESDLVTLGRVVGVSMVDLLLEDEVGRSGSTGGHGGNSRAHHSTVVETPLQALESTASLPLRLSCFAA